MSTSMANGQESAMADGQESAIADGQESAIANGQESAESTVESTVSMATTAELLHSTGIAARRSSETIQSQTINSLARPLENDPWIYRIVVIVLGLVMLIGAGGSVALALVPTAKDVPTILIALGSAAVGAMAGLLAPSPNNK